MRNVRATLLLSTLAAFHFAGCSSPGNDGSIHFDLSSYQGRFLTVDISPTGALTLTESRIMAPGMTIEKYTDVSGTCKAADAATGIITCSASSSSNPSAIASDATLRFLEVPGAYVYVAVEPAASASSSETHLTGATQYYETGTGCAGFDGDYSYFETNSIVFGVQRFQLSANEFRAADFSLPTSGTSFDSQYATTLDGGAGIHNMLSSQCVGSIRLVNINDPGGWVPTLWFFATDSGLLTNGVDSYVPAKNVAALSDLAGKSFKGVQQTNSGAAVPVSFTFGALASDASVSVSTFASSAIPSLDYTLMGDKFLAASGSAAGSRFAGAVAANNDLSSSYATAASVPGLLYSLSQPVATGEQPVLATVWKTTSGKLGITILNTQRIDVSSEVVGYTLTTAIEE